ncbi:hypothetical protein [Paenalcaligenes faecalis]|uniref:hypothetical protein n=1 Tax=Paenalcaligenes faecalis TaxID=2980099 RepID=UPI0022B9B8C6|nr:hypothetical protein [Paenalcaligenes faecalis]
MNSDPASFPNWELAPSTHSWCAQDENGDWYWYSVEPQLSIGGGVWRSNSRHQQFAQHGTPNPDWMHSLQLRPSTVT